MQAFLFTVLGPIFRSSPEAAAIYAPEGACCEAGETSRFPELGDLLERLGREGPAFLYDGDVGRARVASGCSSAAACSAREDLAAYEVVEREPARVDYRGREVLTNPPPSSRADPDRRRAGHPRAAGPTRATRPSVAEVIATHQPRARRGVPRRAWRSEGFLERFLAADALDTVAGEVRSRLGNTTHISVLDAEGDCATRHLLQRLVLGRGRARHRHAPQQHARRGGPQPVRLPPPPGRAPACRA